MAKILVLDDQDYRFVVEEVLKREGYEVTTADNPQKAINLFWG